MPNTKTGRDNGVLVCRIQDRLLSMSIGGTSVVWGRVVTRLTDDQFELDTIGSDVSGSAEWAAEEIADSFDGVSDYTTLEQTRQIALSRSRA